MQPHGNVQTESPFDKPTLGTVQVNLRLMPRGGMEREMPDNRALAEGGRIYRHLSMCQKLTPDDG